MAKKLKKIISLLIVIVLIFSFFALSFSMSVLDGSKRELREEMNNLPFSPFFTVKITNPFLQSSNSETLKIINNPLLFLLAISEEEIPTLANHKPKELDWDKINYITEQDAKELEKSPYIKDAFVVDSFTGPFSGQAIKIKGTAAPMMFISPQFFNDLSMPLEFGNYFHLNSQGNVIILTHRASEEAFGNTNPVGKFVWGTSISDVNDEGAIHFTKKYRVIGVLKPLSNNDLFASFGMTEAFVPLPEDFKPLSELRIPKWEQKGSILDEYKLGNILYVLPKKGEYRKALLILKNKMKNKGLKNRKDVSPKIVWTNENLSEMLSIKSREEKIKYVLYAVLFLVFVSLFTAISFLAFEMLNKRREISIKRALGESKVNLFSEYLRKYIIISFVSFAVSIGILFVLLPALKGINISGNLNTYGVPISTMFTPHPLYIGKLTIIVGIIALVFVSISSVYLSIRKIVVATPAGGMRQNNLTIRHRRFNGAKIVLVTVMTISIAGIIFPTTLREVTINRIFTVYDEIKPEVIRITFNLPLLTLNSHSSRNFALGNPNYTYEDYLAVKKFIGSKGIVDFRSNRPEIQNGVRIVSATPTTPEIYGLKVMQGRFISNNDVGKKVCVVGYKYAKKMHTKIGATLLFHNLSNGLNGPVMYTVIGILTPTNPLVDNTVYFPYGAVPTNSVFIGNLGNFLGSGIFLIKANNPDERITLAKEALDLLNKRHPDKNPGVIYDIEKYTNIILRSATSLYTLLSIFMLLALLSAFLSLSALLFIEVIRRTREIGIKKAIGATAKDITKEFTMNGLITTLIALIIGIPTGIAVSLIIEKLKGWNYYIPINILILVTLISLLLGFLFSYLPALFASKTNPVEAIKSE